MSDLLPAWPLLSPFLIASFILAVTPGPGVFYIVARSLLQGRHFGLASVAVSRSATSATPPAHRLATLSPIPRHSPLGQSLTLGALFVVMAVVTDTVYALAAGAAAPVLARARGVPAIRRYLTGGAFIGLSVFTVLGRAQREVVASPSSAARPHPRRPCP